MHSHYLKMGEKSNNHAMEERLEMCFFCLDFCSVPYHLWGFEQ